MSLQIFDSLVSLHKVGFCHWDLKLDNICFFKDQYYLIDFAFAQRIDPHGPKEITMLKGNSMFASIRKLLLWRKATPVDDFESLFYLIAFCLDSFYLPWLPDYLNENSDTADFIVMRTRKAETANKYLYADLNQSFIKGLRYIHRITKKEKKFLNQDEEVDTNFIRECLVEMQTSFSATKQNDFVYKEPDCSDCD